jgi:hypothetical protein
MTRLPKSPFTSLECASRPKPKVGRLEYRRNMYGTLPPGPLTKTLYTQILCIIWPIIPKGEPTHSYPIVPSN